MPKVIVDLVGQVFSSLTIVSKSETVSNNGSANWNCSCSCGNKTTADSKTLKRGDKKSCGCLLSIHLANRKANSIKTNYKKEYVALLNCKARCNRPKNKDYHNYGGRGISVCERWNSFDNFLFDMGKCPEGYSLERIDVNENYCPENCKWIPLKEQALNRRNTVYIKVDGTMICVAELSRILGISYYTLSKKAKQGLSLTVSQSSFQ